VTYPFIRAKWFTPTSGRRVDLVVVHTAETPEGVNTARAVSNYFATTDTKASAHFCVDPKNIFQCVLEKDVAYAAPGANHNGVHIELSGRAAQTAGEWHDPYSTAMLKKAAPLVADLCARHKIPVRYVPAAQLVAGGAAARGITTHNEVSKAFRRSTHTDPGVNFPMIEFVNAVLGGTTPTPPVSSPNETPKPGGVMVRNYLASLVAPNGGTWHLATDGGIVTDTDGAGGPMAPYLGSVPGSGGAGVARVRGILPHKGGYKVVVTHPDETISYFHYGAT